MEVEDSSGWSKIKNKDGYLFKPKEVLNSQDSEVPGTSHGDGGDGSQVPGPSHGDGGDGGDALANFSNTLSEIDNMAAAVGFNLAAAPNFDLAVLDGDGDLGLEVVVPVAGPAPAHPTRGNIHLDPNWLQNLKTTFLPERSPTWSMKSREAFENNEFIEEWPKFRDVRKEILDSLADHVVEFCGTMTTPSKQHFQEIIQDVLAKYPFMFTAAEGSASHIPNLKKRRGSGGSGGLINLKVQLWDLVYNRQADIRKASSGGEIQRKGRKRIAAGNTFIVYYIIESFLLLHYSGVDNYKYYDSSATQLQRDEYESTANLSDAMEREQIFARSRSAVMEKIRGGGDVAAPGADPGDVAAPGVAAALGAVPGLDPNAAELEEVEQREGVYDMNRDQIQQEINVSTKVVSKVVRGFFDDPIHIRGQFQWLTGVPSLLEKIHLNIGREVRRAEKYLVSKDKKMKREIQDVHNAMMTEYNGNQMYAQFKILRYLGDTLERKNGDGRALFLLEGEPMVTAGPHLRVIFPDER